MKFKELCINEKVLEGIRDAGFIECTPVQAMTLPTALLGRDIAVQAQTGTGKTATFLITVLSRMLSTGSPGFKHSPRTLIIAPTRELVLQIDAETRLLGHPAGVSIVSVYGGVDYQKQKHELARGTDILIGTPGRLIDYLKQKVYSLKKTQFLVVDEADRLFDMGFISDVRYILRRMSPYNMRQSMLFSATLSSRVIELCYEHMNLPEQFTIAPENITVKQVVQEIYHIGMSEKFGLLLGILKRNPEGRYLIFCNTKAVAQRLSILLNANNFSTATITGDLPQKRRLKVLSSFRDGSLSILIATDVASRGLHIEGVTHVINYDLPQDAENYVHRIGRTARAGAQGKAISLACEEYVHSLPDIEAYIRQKIPVMALTDEMIVTSYRRRLKYKKKPSLPPGARRHYARKNTGKEIRFAPTSHKHQSNRSEAESRSRDKKPFGKSPKKT